MPLRSTVNQQWYGFYALPLYVSKKLNKKTKYKKTSSILILSLFLYSYTSSMAVSGSEAIAAMIKGATLPGEGVRETKYSLILTNKKYVTYFKNKKLLTDPSMVRDLGS